MNKEELNKKRKEPVWFYLLLIIIPIVLLLVLELSLTLFNYGNDYSTFVKLPGVFQEYKFFNPKLPQKYFGNSNVIPSVIPDGFREIKNNDTFRIFALGGSTTAGFPHPPNGSFPRQLKHMLAEKYPKVHFEVINLGISAVNSITMRDIIDDVLEEDPDLIIIYSGHNEYYGALGAASSTEGISSPALSSFVLKIKNFRLFQLVEKVLKKLLSLFNDTSDKNGTLMSEMAGKNLVDKNSEIFFSGLEQFELNIKSILEKCSNKKVPVMIGTVASNLLQTPLCRLGGCNSLVEQYNAAVEEIDSSDYEKLYEIKDDDALRFRAPEEINDIITEVSQTYNCVLFDVKTQFEELSEFNIIGHNLMMDHLHPNYKGNSIIAELLLKKIIDEKYVEEIVSKPGKYGFNNFSNLKNYSTLDSSLAQLRIDYLKNDFPFRKKAEKEFVKLESMEDSLSSMIINGMISWEGAHEKLAMEYLKSGNLFGYSTEMNVLIEDKPFDESTFIRAINNLENKHSEKYLVQLLMKYFKYFPKGITAKKIGNIYRNVGNLPAAQYFYNVALDFNTNDAEIYFNLSSIYYHNKQLKDAFSYIKKCLELNPNYPNAQKIYNSLKQRIQK